MYKMRLIILIRSVKLEKLRGHHVYDNPGIT